jgi:hypothetical protein
LAPLPTIPYGLELGGFCVHASPIGKKFSLAEVVESEFDLGFLKPIERFSKEFGRRESFGLSLNLACSADSGGRIGHRLDGAGR